MIIKRINILEPDVANKIAAGEVAERPAAIIKELVENSLDAGATAVTVEITGGGIEYMRVTDNGCGIPSEDVAKAFLRHATSKLSSAEGLDGIETLGFRGEALASIAAVSSLEMRTRTEQDESGTRIRIEGGEIKDLLPCGCPLGTNTEVRDLFYNVPARLKFLKAPRAEAAAVGDYITRLILGSTDVSIRFISNGKPVYHSAGDGSLYNAIACVYGPEACEHIMPVHYDDGYVLIEGCCGDEHLSRNTRAQQTVFVNGRYIRSQQLSYAAQRAYITRLMVGRYPFFVLNIRLSPREVDVNVHPNKLTVKFKDEERVSAAFAAAIRTAIANKDAEAYSPGDNAETCKGAEADDREERSGSAFGQELRAADAPVPNAQKPASHASSGVITGRLQSERQELDRLYELFKNDKKPCIEPARQNEPPTQNREHSGMLYDSAAAGAAPAGMQTADVMTFDFRRREHEKELVSEKIAFDVSPYTVIGVAFDTYIIVEQGDAVFYIDQHAAHERILYERLVSGSLKFHSQLLLTKLVISLTPTEFALVEQHIERFAELGFDIEPFGASAVSVQAIPFGVKTDSAERLVRDMIAVVEKNGALSELDLVRNELIQASCKHAVKAGQRLLDEEIAEILSYYAAEGAPKTCPHGRPIMLRVSRRELEKMFKRVL